MKGGKYGMRSKVFFGVLLVGIESGIEDGIEVRRWSRGRHRMGHCWYRKGQFVVE